MTVRRILKTSVNTIVCKFSNLKMNRNAKIYNLVTSADIDLHTNKFKKVCHTTLKKEERDKIWENY